MGRLKSKLATSPLDQLLHGHLADADKSLVRGLDLCRQASQGSDPRKVREISRTIMNARRLLEAVGHLPVNEPSSSMIARTIGTSASFSERDLRTARFAAQKQLREQKAAAEVEHRRKLYEQYLAGEEVD